jgi:sodium:sulfate symporter-like transmembrane protein
MSGSVILKVENVGFCAHQLLQLCSDNRDLPFELTAQKELVIMPVGIMGVVSPYGAGPSPIYYGSGYLPARDYWRLGGIFGLIFLTVFLAVGVPWVLLIK